MKEIEEFNDLLELVDSIGDPTRWKGMEKAAKLILESIQIGEVDDVDDVEEISNVFNVFYGLGIVFGIETLMKFCHEGHVHGVLQAENTGKLVELLVAYIKKRKEEAH